MNHFIIELPAVEPLPPRIIEAIKCHDRAILEAMTDELLEFHENHSIIPEAMEAGNSPLIRIISSKFIWDDWVEIVENLVKYPNACIIQLINEAFAEDIDAFYNCEALVYEMGENAGSISEYFVGFGPFTDAYRREGY